jgi:hypothetical protein
VPDERAFIAVLDIDAMMRVRFTSDHGRVLRFTVQLETKVRDDWMPVARYDDAHGRPHLDILDQSGREISKHWIDATKSEVLTEGINDFRRNWKRYVLRFKEGM